MELNLLELFGTPPPFALVALAVGAAVVAMQLVRRLRARDQERVAVHTSWTGATDAERRAPSLGVRA